MEALKNVTTIFSQKNNTSTQQRCQQPTDVEHTYNTGRNLDLLTRPWTLHPKQHTWYPTNTSTHDTMYQGQKERQVRLVHQIREDARHA